MARTYKLNKVNKTQNVSRSYSTTYGSDPELMIYSLEKNTIVSSIPILKRDKHNPILLDKENDIRLFADNTLAEIAFRPCSSKDELINRFRTAFKNVQNYLGDKYKIIPKAAHEFPKEDLKPSYGIDPNLIGCDVSYNGWLKAINTPPPFKSGLRTGSTHFHLGNEKLTDFDTRIDMIRLLDIHLGCSFVIADKDVSSSARRVYYGRASDHRPCNYGLEYRVLSPYVLSSPKLVELAVDIIDYSMEHLENNTVKEVIDLIKPEMVQESINTCNINLARQVLNDAKFPSNLMKRVELDYKPNFYKDWSI